MANKDDDLDLDGLLEPEAPAPEIAPEPEAAEPVAADPEEYDSDIEDAKRLAELQKQVAVAKKPKASMYDDKGRPKPESELTDVQRQIRAAEDELARTNQRNAETADTEYEAPASDAGSIHIHMLHDGFVVNGQVTYRGEEFKFDPNGEAYAQTKDRLGASWLDLVDDVDAQWDRWGKQVFGRGPWRGRRVERYTINDVPADVPARERESWVYEANAGLDAERRRNFAAPVMPGLASVSR